jgi:hypothetical protein
VAKLELCCRALITFSEIGPKNADLDRAYVEQAGNLAPVNIG